jgi:hypothetical protein
MPVILTAPTAAETAIDAESILFHADGRYTLEGVVIANFIESVDWTDLFDHEDMADLVETETIKGIEDEDGSVVEDENGEDISLDSVDGETAVECLDMDDLVAMFEDYAESMPEDTIEEKALKAAALGLLGVEEIDEAKKGETAPKWGKKGYMVKVRSGALKSSSTRTGAELVNSMLGAMVAKGVISRKTKDSAYKAPGAKKATYTKSSATQGSGQKQFNHDPADANIKDGKTSYSQGSAKFPWFTQKGKAEQKGKKTAQKAGKKRAADKTPGGKKKTYKAAVSMKKAKEVVQAKKKGGSPTATKGNKPKKAAGFESRADGGSLVTESVGLTARMYAHRNAAAARDKKAITG